MSADLEPLLKRLHLANARRVWRDLCQRAEKEEWSYEAFLQTLVAEEVAHPRGTRLVRAVRKAWFPFTRTIEEFDVSYQSTLRLTTIGSLLTPDFVTEGRSVILEGEPGHGKTHLAIAVADRAMQNGFDALFTTAATLIEGIRPRMEALGRLPARPRMSEPRAHGPSEPRAVVGGPREVRGLGRVRREVLREEADLAADVRVVALASPRRASRSTRARACASDCGSRPS